MNLGWKLLIPLSLLWFLALAAIEIGDDRNWNRGIVLAVVVGAFVFVGGLLMLALKAEKESSSFSSPFEEIGNKDMEAN